MRLELEITHRCNKNCPLCDHRIASSDYDYLFNLIQGMEVLEAFRIEEDDGLRWPQEGAGER